MIILSAVCFVYCAQQAKADMLVVALKAVTTRDCCTRHPKKTTQAFTMYCITSACWVAAAC